MGMVHFQFSLLGYFALADRVRGIRPSSDKRHSETKTLGLGDGEGANFSLRSCTP